MPHIPVSCPSGYHEWFYSISTSQYANAIAIEEGRPVVFFIHAGYGSQDMFESQFTDPELRQFNLVAVDLLGHGSTRGTIGDERYSPKETAQDLKHVMDALGLPPCHIFGLSIGGQVGLELASAYPSQVLSLTICSPVTPTELEDVATGRLQVFNYWSEVFQSYGDSEETRQKQEELLDETLYGAMQLLYNNEHSGLIDAIGRCAMVRAIDIWSGSRKKLKLSYDACIRWVMQRADIPQSSLEKIRCPVHIIHCSEDVGYPEENARVIADRLQKAGVAVSLYHVGGPHCGNIPYAHNINLILRDAIFAASNLDEDSLSKPKGDFNGNKMLTPWTELLRRFGYDPEADSDDDESSESFTDDSHSWFSYAPVVPEARRASSPPPS